MNTSNIKKIIFIITIILILVISAFIGYTTYFNTNKEAKPSDQSMSKLECENNNGGEWSEMEILRDEGHIYRYFCICPKKDLLPDMLIWISEGEMKKCP